MLDFDRVKIKTAHILNKNMGYERREKRDEVKSESSYF